MLGAERVSDPGVRGNSSISKVLLTQAWRCELVLSNHRKADGGLQSQRQWSAYLVTEPQPRWEALLIKQGRQWLSLTSGTHAQKCMLEIMRFFRFENIWVDFSGWGSLIWNIPKSILEYFRFQNILDFKILDWDIHNSVPYRIIRIIRNNYKGSRVVYLGVEHMVSSRYC